MNTIETINNLNDKALRTALLKCCASKRWTTKLMASRPFADKDDLFLKAKKIWLEKCKKEDWLEAFLAHPKIGDLNSLKIKYATTKKWSSNEQAGVDSASKKTLEALADGNKKYENKFGYIFIVCATGKSAKEMLDLLNARLKNNPEKEILIAMQEQHKITEIRLDKWLMAQKATTNTKIFKK